jgi:hypothetical protein
MESAKSLSTLGPELYIRAYGVYAAFKFTIRVVVAVAGGSWSASIVC